MLLSLFSLALGIEELFVTFIIPFRKKSFENVDVRFSLDLIWHSCKVCLHGSSTSFICVVYIAFAEPFHNRL